MGIPSLYKAFFRGVEGLKEASAAIFKKCIEQLRFNPTILTSDSKRYIKIHLILNKLIKRARYIATHQRKEEGKLLYKILEKEVVNIARYYYYKTIRVSKQDNNIFNIHKGLDIIKATNYKLKGLIMPPKLARVSSRKRSSSYSALLPPGKRLYLTSLTKRPIIQNRAAMLTILEGGIKGYESLYTQAGII
ncbi:hypothetical protein V2W45_1481967 [Cenococcum geophilum]